MESKHKRVLLLTKCTISLMSVGMNLKRVMWIESVLHDDSFLEGEKEGFLVEWKSTLCNAFENLFQNVPETKIRDFVLCTNPIATIKKVAVMQFLI